MRFVRPGGPILERHAPKPGAGPRCARRSHGIVRALGASPRAIRGAFACLLLAALLPAAAPQAAAATTVEVTGFGSNPGNLRMFKHVPDGIAASPPLIVVLHGCTQNARDYAAASGWIQMAERLRVPLAMAEQRPSNNQNRCFNWFVRGDNRRGQGEALSIRQIVDKMREDHGIDPARVFVTGLSAGGGIVAGLPYGCASDPTPSQPTQALQCMSTGHPTSPLVGLPGSVPFVVPLPPAVCQLIPIPIPGCSQDDDEAPTSAAEWGDRVRQASSHTGPFPRVSIWHGSADRTVSPINAESSMLQWTNAHGLGPEPSAQDTVKGHPRRIFRNVSGTAVVEAVMVSRTAHGVPVDPGAGADQCGTATAFVLDADICSSLHIAKFWGLVPN